ncbi:MAG: hypothetical protein HW413_1462 [Thermoleophilia bacterium]|nr:hypothetical protein [Thermoleophilia bacterium]
MCFRDCGYPRPRPRSGRFRDVAAAGGTRGLHPLLRMQTLREVI